MTTTTFDETRLTVAADGSFAYQINTTADFIDPSSGSIFSPAGAADYEASFTLNTSATYAITAQLNLWGRVSLSLPSGYIFNQFNSTAAPAFVNLSGLLPPGQYLLIINSSLGAPNLPSGVNHYTASGSFESVVFSVQVPEPAPMEVTATLIMGNLCSRRRRRACNE